MSNNRKDTHVKQAIVQKRYFNAFESVQLFHNSIPNLNYNELDLSSNYLGHNFKYPFYINAMTGGSSRTKLINEQLARIAKKFNLALFVGSQSSALKDSSLEDTFSVVTKINENGFNVANINLNYNYESLKEAISMIDAKAAAIHLNVIQEMAMTEGDRNFSMWEHNLKDIISKAKLPIIVKEVGFGMSSFTIDKLIKIGVKNIDISGKGGTNFAKIETSRTTRKESIFDGLGITTVDSLINSQPYQEEVNVFASGGVNNALDAFKCIVLGAKAVGLSYFFLNLLSYDESEIDQHIEDFISDFKKLMLIYNVKQISEIKNVKYKVSQ